MAIVNITVTPRGVVVQPENVVINRVDQSITWQLQGGTWASNGIVLDQNPPAPYVAWPGQPAQPVGQNWVANGNDPLPPGASAQQYRYWINIHDDQGNLQTRVIGANGSEISIDPGIENQPEP